MPFHFVKSNKCGLVAVCLQNIVGERHRVEACFEIDESQKRLVQSEKVVWLQPCGTWLRIDNADSKSSAQEFHEAPRD